MNMYLPIALAIVSDVVYQVASKSTPPGLNPFASLTITYLIASAFSTAVFFITSRGGSLVHEWSGINWTAFVLGFAIVGLEAGSIFMYKAGWNINTGYVVKAISVGILLIAVGYLAYKEQITVTKVAGVAVCLAGLVLINK